MNLDELLLQLNFKKRFHHKPMKNLVKDFVKLHIENLQHYSEK